MEQVNSFAINPILNSPYEYPGRHWEMDGHNQPTAKINDFRRPSSLRSPIVASRRQRGNAEQGDLFAETESGVDYSTNEFINSIRAKVDEWRRLPPESWGVTAETARLLKHWRNADNFPDIRPFFCQVEAVETLIWLTEVANTIASGKKFLEKIALANSDADPNLYRIALKLATGAGKTTVMAMIIAWQTINAARHGVSSKFTNGFLITTPGITIKDRLRVLLPNDSESYYQHRNLVPKDLLPLVESARIVITNYHAFQLKSTLELSSGTKAMLVGPTGVGGPQMTETPGQMISRVLGDAAGLKNILMINDEAHHCYRHRPTDEQMNRGGFGIVPISIDEVLKSDDKEIKFVITGTADEYETHTYEIPVPMVNGAHPYYAKATLVYFPDCDRSQGVDYTITEMDIYFGRAALKNGRPAIIPINKNTQDNEEDYGPYEESARGLFRKWDNVKHIAEELNPRARPKKSTLSQMWGLKILTKDRRPSGVRDKVKFGVIITLRAMDNKNRYNDFIDLCQMHHWIVNPVVPVVRAEAYQQANSEIGLV